MAINYTPVGWDTTKYINPTNMNQMDNGIKAACDGVDALTEDVNEVNESVSKNTADIATVNESLGKMQTSGTKVGDNYFYRFWTSDQNNVILTVEGDFAHTNIHAFGDSNNYPFDFVVSGEGYILGNSNVCGMGIDASNNRVVFSLQQWSGGTIISNRPLAITYDSNDYTSLDSSLIKRVVTNSDLEWTSYGTKTGSSGIAIASAHNEFRFVASYETSAGNVSNVIFNFKRNDIDETKSNYLFGGYHISDSNYLMVQLKIGGGSVSIVEALQSGNSILSSMTLKGFGRVR